MTSEQPSFASTSTASVLCDADILSAIFEYLAESVADLGRLSGVQRAWSHVVSRYPHPWIIALQGILPQMFWAHKLAECSFAMSQAGPSRTFWRPLALSAAVMKLTDSRIQGAANRYWRESIHEQSLGFGSRQLVAFHNPRVPPLLPPSGRAKAKPFIVALSADTAAHDYILRVCEPQKGWHRRLCSEFHVLFFETTKALWLIMDVSQLSSAKRPEAQSSQLDKKARLDSRFANHRLFATQQLLSSSEASGLPEMPPGVSPMAAVYLRAISKAAHGVVLVCDSRTGQLHGSAPPASFHALRAAPEVEPPIPPLPPPRRPVQSMAVVVSPEDGSPQVSSKVCPTPPVLDPEDEASLQQAPVAVAPGEASRSHQTAASTPLTAASLSGSSNCNPAPLAIHAHSSRPTASQQPNLGQQSPAVSPSLPGPVSSPSADPTMRAGATGPRGHLAAARGSPSTVSPSRAKVRSTTLRADDLVQRARPSSAAVAARAASMDPRRELVAGQFDGLRNVLRHCRLTGKPAVVFASEQQGQHSNEPLQLAAMLTWLWPPQTSWLVQGTTGNHEGSIRCGVEWVVNQANVEAAKPTAMAISYGRDGTPRFVAKKGASSRPLPPLPSPTGVTDLSTLAPLSFAELHQRVKPAFAKSQSAPLTTEKCDDVAGGGGEGAGDLVGTGGNERAAAGPLR